LSEKRFLVLEKGAVEPFHLVLCKVGDPIGF